MLSIIGFILCCLPLVCIVLTVLEDRELAQEREERVRRLDERYARQWHGADPIHPSEME